MFHTLDCPLPDPSILDEDFYKLDKSSNMSMPIKLYKPTCIGHLGRGYPCYPTTVGFLNWDTRVCTCCHLYPSYGSHAHMTAGITHYLNVDIYSVYLPHLLNDTLNKVLEEMHHDTMEWFQCSTINLLASALELTLESLFDSHCHRCHQKWSSKSVEMLNRLRRIPRPRGRLGQCIQTNLTCHHQLWPRSYNHTWPWSKEFPGLDCTWS